jgi:hypothetical protein
MRPHLAVGLVLVVLVAAACGGGAPAPTPAAATSYTCCLRDDVDRVWQPGETLTLHWTAKPGTGSGASHVVRLTATLTGPYADVGALKRGGAAARRLQNTVTTTDERTETAPVNSIVLPADLPPGLYNLATEIDYGDGNRTGGASIVRVGVA